jgi:hypothetical protein
MRLKSSFWCSARGSTRLFKLAELVRQIEETAAAQRQENGIPVLGADGVTEQVPEARPGKLKKSPAPLFMPSGSLPGKRYTKPTPGRRVLPGGGGEAAFRRSKRAGVGEKAGIERMKKVTFSSGLKYLGGAYFGTRL